MSEGFSIPLPEDCAQCGLPIIWAESPNGQTLPYNRSADEETNLYYITSRENKIPIANEGSVVPMHLDVCTGSRENT